MPKPSAELSNQQLHKGLMTGKYEGRDALVAEEILRRRHEALSDWEWGLL